MRLRPEIVHVHSPYPLGEVGAWLLKPRVPLAVTYHSDVVRQQGWLKVYGPLLQRVLRRADRILPTSPGIWRRRRGCLRCATGARSCPGGGSPAVHPASNSLSGPPTLLFVGRLRYYKGLDTLLQAMPMLPAEVRLRVVGTGPMQDEWEHW